jgi:hypothetical protein
VGIGHHRGSFFLLAACTFFVGPDGPVRRTANRREAEAIGAFFFGILRIGQHKGKKGQRGQVHERKKQTGRTTVQEHAPMEELTQLKRSALKKKPQRNPVPRAVNYWLFFKRRILEPREVRVQFSEADPPLDLEGFRRLVRRVANPAKWGPSFCRHGRGGRSSKTAKRFTNDMLAVLWRYYEMLLHPASPLYVDESETAGGLGLFARRGVVLREGGHLFGGHLWGVPFEITQECFDELHASGYPSLYRTPDDRCHILCGPLALVNHQCTAALAFSLPRKVDSARASRESLALEEFDGLRAVYVKSTARCRLRKGQEITVRYADIQARPRRRRPKETENDKGEANDPSKDDDGEEDDSAVDSSMTFGGAPCRCASCTTSRARG